MTKESGLKSGSAERGVGSEFQVGGSLNTRRQSENTNCDDHICDKVKIQPPMKLIIMKSKPNDDGNFIKIIMIEKAQYF